MVFAHLKIVGVTALAATQTVDAVRSSAGHTTRGGKIAEIADAKGTSGVFTQTEEQRRIGAGLLRQFKEVNPDFGTSKYLEQLKEKRDAKKAAKHRLARTIRGSNAVEAGCLKCSHRDGTVYT